MNINELIKGNQKFREVSFPKFEGNIKELVEHGQKPEILFIGCSDSRVTPTLMLDTKPGDIFMLRNVGNFVPSYKIDDAYHECSAVIEYAVSILNVKHIIICGHSHCGACKSLYNDIGDSPDLMHIKKWLELGRRAKEYTLLAIEDKEDKENLYRTTERISIVHQLENLLTYPQIGRKVKAGELQIHGWYYKLEDGTIENYDGEAYCFKPLSEQNKSIF